MDAEGAVADEADLGVEAFEAAVGQAEADGSEDAVAVLTQGADGADERLEPGARGPGQPGVEVRRRECGVGQVVAQSQLLAQQEGAVEALVGLLDLPWRGELADGLVLGGLEQRPAGALDPAACRRVAAVVTVPFVAADLIGGAGAESDDVKRIRLLAPRPPLRMRNP